MKDIYVFLFMGQSNMAGRGIAAQAPKVPRGWGYEYRALTMPDTLVPLEEPFGAEENNPQGVFEPGMKTGSLVSAFVNAAYPVLGIPLAGVSCAKGGSSIMEWEPGSPYYLDGLMRLQKCRACLSSGNYRIRGVYMVWCQGCTDGDRGMTREEYRKKAGEFFSSFMEQGKIDRCFLIQTGNHRDNPALYKPIQDAQEDLCGDNKKIIMVSRTFKTCAARGLMKDAYHYLQAAYNEIGTEAGANAARFIRDEINQPKNLLRRGGRAAGV
jgi:hypothetical protein